MISNKLCKDDWDKFDVKLEEAGSASEKHQDWYKNAAVLLKVLTTFLTFSIGKIESSKIVHLNTLIHKWYFSFQFFVLVLCLKVPCSS